MCVWERINDGRLFAPAGAKTSPSTTSRVFSLWHFTCFAAGRGQYYLRGCSSRPWWDSINRMTKWDASYLIPPVMLIFDTLLWMMMMWTKRKWDDGISGDFGHWYSAQSYFDELIILLPHNRQCMKWGIVKDLIMNRARIDQEKVKEETFHVEWPKVKHKPELLFTVRKDETQKREAQNKVDLQRPVSVCNFACAMLPACHAPMSHSNNNKCQLNVSFQPGTIFHCNWSIQLGVFVIQFHDKECFHTDPLCQWKVHSKVHLDPHSPVDS